MYATKIHDWKVKVSVSWTSQAARPMIKKRKGKKEGGGNSHPGILPDEDPALQSCGLCSHHSKIKLYWECKHKHVYSTIEAMSLVK